MNAFVKIITLTAALALSSQPCLAAAADSQTSTAPTTIVVEAADPVTFNLATHGQAHAASNPAGALPLATSVVTAQEAEASQDRQDREQRGRKGPSTAVIVGGVALVGLIVLAVVASNQMKKGWDWDW